MSAFRLVAAGGGDGGVNVDNNVNGIVVDWMIISFVPFSHSSSEVGVHCIIQS